MRQGNDVASRTPGFNASKMSWYTPSTIAHAWVSSMARRGS